MPGIFELSLPGEEPLGLVGPWQAAATPVSFEAGAASAGEDVPVWRVNLPEDELAAAQALAQAEQQVAQAETALRQVPGRLDDLTARLPRGGGVSFEALSFSAEPDSPEASMLQLLGHVQAVEQGRAVSYGLEDFASKAWEEARDQFEAFLEQIQREVLNFAWVETSVAQRLLARTSVGWSGDNNTIWLEGIGQQETEMHRRTLQVAVKTRALRIRMFSTVTGGAAKLAVLLTTPAGALMALPAAWKYVAEILQQVKNYQTLSQGG